MSRSRYTDNTNNNTRVERTLRIPLNIYEEFEEKVVGQYGEGKMNQVIVELMNRFLKQKSVMKLTPSNSIFITSKKE